MAQKSRQLALHRIAPWKSSTAWWIILIEGIITLGVGGYLIVSPFASRQTVGFLIGLYLIVSSILHLVPGIWKSAHSSTRDISSEISLLRALIGLLIGLLVVLVPFSKTFYIVVVPVILGVGFLLSGVIGLYAAFTADKQSSQRGKDFIDSLLYIVLAVFLFFLAKSGTFFLNWIALVAVGFGVLLIGYAISLLKRGEHASQPTPAAEV